MDNSLRDLAGKYNRGALGREAYLQARTELIDGIEAGTAPLIAFTPPPPKPPQNTATAENETPKVTPAITSAPETKRGPIWGLAIGVTVAVLAAAVWYVSRDEPVPSEGPPQVRVDDSAGRALIENFLATNDWRAESLNQFSTDWQTLGRAQRAELGKTLPCAQLRDGVYDQLIEEQTLAELGDSAAANNQQQRLLKFAASVGIDGQRFSDVANDLEESNTTIADQTAVSLADSETVDTTLARLPEQPVTEPETLAAELLPATSEPSPETRVDESATEIEDEPAHEPIKVVEPAVVEETKSKVEPVLEAVTPSTSTAARPPEQPETTTPEPAQSVTQTPLPVESNTKKRRREGCHAELASTRRPFCRDRLGDVGNGPIMVVLPAGKFTMGANGGNEGPPHEVNISYNLAMSVNEVTAKEFGVFCKDTERKCPSQPWPDGDYPVVNVSWQDASAYATWLSEHSSKNYRLPSEAEWEYAARAGTTTKYPFGDELLPTHARFAYTSQPDSPLPKSDRSINRNKFRLYHMVGNVREWVADGWSTSHQGAPANGSIRNGEGSTTRVVRGGSYQDGSEALRSAAREALPASSVEKVTGFRVVVDLRDASDAAMKMDPDSAWLASQDRSRKTLQLFAVSKLYRVEKLIDTHPELALRVLPTSSSDVSYRVVYGSFEDSEQARAAFTTLPADVIALAGAPMVRSIAVLQGDAGSR
jgi:formylglycine-generating enzyme required for sulfatase activity